MYLLKFSPFFLFFFIVVEGGVIPSHDGEEHGLQGSASLSLRGNGFGRLQSSYSGIGYGGSSENLFGAAGNVVSGVFGAAGRVVQGVGNVATGVVGGIAGGLNQGAGHLSSHAGYSGQVDAGNIGVGHQKVNAGIYFGNEYQQGAGNIVIDEGHQQANDRIHFGNEYEHANTGDGSIAGQSSEHLKQSANQGSLSAVNAKSFIDAGDSSRISSSKSSSSSSNKSSKRKTNTNFEGSSSNINLGAQGTSQSHDLNFDENQGFSSGVNADHGLFGAKISANKYVGLSLADASNQYSSSLLGNNSQIKGSSNTEVEESESNNQSQSETFENVKDSHLKAGSQFGSVNQSYNNQQQDADKQNAWIF